MRLRDVPRARRRGRSLVPRRRRPRGCRSHGAEISPSADRAARALVAPHLERIRAEARESAEIGVGVRVHLRLMAEAGGCGVGVSDEDAVSAFGSDPAAAARSRAATVRRHAAALLETLWAAHDRERDEERTARHPHPRGADRRGGEADFVAEFERDDDDDARGGGAHVGATIEETSRLVSLLDDALVVVDGGLEALAATTEALSEMIESALDALGPRAWRYPPALAGRVYAQLLRASFDPVDEGAVSDDLDAFRDALLHPEGAARAMGIRPAAHAALHAWCLARHHRAWIVGEGPLATSPTTARSAGARAFAFAADAEADADEPEEAYALLTAATRALARVEDAERDEREMRRTRHVGREETLDDDVGVAGSNPGLEAESVLVHAATGPVAWWAEGALGDFFQDTSPPAGSLARGPSRAALDPRRGPEMTPDGFEATLALGVAAARARAPPPPRRSRPISRAIRATPVAPRDARSPSEYADTPSAKPTRVYAPPPTRRLTPTRTRNSTPTRTRKPTPTPRTRPGCERWRRDARRWRTRSRRICRRACRPPSVGRRRPPRPRPSRSISPRICARGWTRRLRWTPPRSPR